MIPGRTRTLVMAFLATGLLLGGCKPQPVEKPNPPPAPPTIAPAAKAPPALSLEMLQREAENVALAPAPREMQVALQKAGIAEPLANLITSKVVQTNVADKDMAAIRTGIVIADTVLTIKEAKTPDLVLRLTRIKEGMQILGGGADIQTTLDELINAVNSGSETRDNILNRMNEVSGSMIQEIKYESGPNVLPLIQAGSWLEGANLVSRAMRNSNQYGAANTLLKQPEVVAYFQKYVNLVGQDKAPEEVVTKLKSALQAIHDVTLKDTLTEEDVKTINIQTDSVLALL